MSKRIRTKVFCYCKKCNGALVDPRTKLKHTSKYNNYQGAESSITGPSRAVAEPSDAEHFGVNQSDAEPSDAEPSDAEPSDAERFGVNPSDAEPADEMEWDPIERLSERNNIFLTKKLPIHESAKIRKGKISDLVLENLLDDESDKNEDDDYHNPDSEEEENYDDYEEEEEEEVNFTLHSTIRPNDDEPNLPNIINSINSNYSFIWIILWILQYQQQYRLSKVAIDSLFKFLRFFLLTIDEKKFSSFPSSLYMAKKTLGIFTKIIKYAACNKCHKLYDINDITNKTEIPICSFINFPNHSIERFRQKCNNPLVKKIDSNNEQILRPIMTFPLVNIRQQLTLFFGRKDFEMSCRKWAAERENDTEALFDIYDGMIWKSFTDDNDEPFFNKENADSHIGLMLNMDWFQPYINSQYSVGVIYVVICNLPRSERFKPGNILTLAVIPGPKEPKLHEINHYLYPIINQLNQLWDGYSIKTYENNKGRSVRGAIIGCSNDVPAARKLCGFISARVACYRCHKSANFVNNQSNFGGFADLDEWFIERDINVIREKASEWKKCTTKDSRRDHVSQYYVRWSEIYRLPYFNSVRFCVVDPMHCLFLGVAKWIVTKLWIGEGILNRENLKIMQERADMIKIASDLGRRPVRIATGEGFSNFTADMWKTFIMIFATPITWDFLDEVDKKILAYFVRACKILTSRELQKSELSEAFTKLVNMNKLIEQKYGQEKISPNLHLCLHICECALDYGPLSSFWCFSFERMNGILGIICKLIFRFLD